jgi:endonuclease/exonuclease/phosphatase family metal-dependent hydrolase
MKILTLNCWGGIQGQTFFDYIKDMKSEVDIFCLQEVYNSINPPNILGTVYERHLLKAELKDILKNYTCYYRESVYNANMAGTTDFNLSYGLCTFVKNKYLKHLFDEGDVIVYGSKNKGLSFRFPTPRNMQYLRFRKNNQILNLYNFHGIWISKYGKMDHDVRDVQSKNIINFINNVDGSIVLTGDFNLLPNTHALLSIEKELNLDNLNTKYNIKSTRSKLYNKKCPFADYTLVSSDIMINSYEVPYCEVSDHLPMILDIRY